jgi:hypothetical protein
LGDNRKSIGNKENGLVQRGEGKRESVMEKKRLKRGLQNMEEAGGVGAATA